MANYPFYNRLSTCSKRYWDRFIGKPELVCSAKFRAPLLKRLSAEFGLTQTQVYEALLKELAKYVKDHQETFK